MNQRDLNRFKKRLLEEKAELEEKARQTLNEDMQLDVDDLPDEMDLASSEYAQSMTFRLRGREKVYLEKIDKALKKIEEGEFGICEECGEEIDVKRLDVRPVTNLCIRCKEKQERREKSFTEE
ncbi:MAG TPA: TraR/DksA C4-type zinc finger protein [Myxococcota bacterium]|nr:TraR/DksA C4-type zinc finger protein [Myxococcota bacterium]